MVSSEDASPTCVLQHMPGVRRHMLRTRRSLQGVWVHSTRLAGQGRRICGGSSARVSFVPTPTNGGVRITIYQVTARDRTESTRENPTAIGSTSPIIVGGLTNGDQYSFTVTDTNMVGTGPASGSSNVVTPSRAFEVLTASQLPSALWGRPSSVKLQTSGASPGATTMEDHVGRPSGLSLGDSGTISGIPTTEVPPGPHHTIPIAVSVTETVGGVKTTATSTLDMSVT